MFGARIRKNIIIFHMKITIFTAVKYYRLYGRVFIMDEYNLREHLYQQVQEQSVFCDVTVEVNSWVRITIIKYFLPLKVHNSFYGDSLWNL